MNDCELCHTPSGQKEAIYLHGRCHMAAPSWARVEDGFLIIACCEPDCRREIARFRISEDGEVSDGQPDDQFDPGPLPEMTDQRVGRAQAMVLGWIENAPPGEAFTFIQMLMGRSKIDVDQVS